jgi:hypothetical protein
MEKYTTNKKTNIDPLGLDTFEFGKNTGVPNVSKLY